jgi:polyhydroxyalkanoate synthase subunit PhaC
MKQTPDIASTNPVDRLFHAWLGRMTLGLSPAALMLAYLDWLAHLSISPAKQAEMAEKALKKATRFGLYASRVLVSGDTPPVIEPLPQDRRWRDEAWQRWPFNLIQQSFLLNQQLWHNATTGIRGVSRHHEHAVSFVARQILDVYSPSNFLLTNPEILQATVREKGQNLWRGWQYFVEDQERTATNRAPDGADKFRVGKEVAVTPGKVIFRNRLIELLQYSPSTEQVWKEPVLIVPAWMMKYYIMDLSPQNSMVKYLVDQGHTVFMISWKNPDGEDRDLDMEDYRSLGVMDAIDAVGAVCPDTQIHSVGYCLGGIITTIAAAAMGRDGDRRLASVTLLTTMTDFNEPGELAVFIDPSEVSFLEDMMWERGYLDPRQAAGSFQLLRSHDLIWSKIVHEYLLGERQPMFDLMAWNADGTRMPYRMHSQLLRRLFLNNDLNDGRYLVGGRPITISDIHAPIFAVGATADHVAPWRSIYKLHLQADAEEVTFVLTSGGHNVGIVNPPGPKAREYQIATSRVGDRYVDPDTWLATAERNEGSWWPAWETWLAQRSTGRVSPPDMGNRKKGYVPLNDAPGSYVLMQ